MHLLDNNYYPFIAYVTCTGLHIGHNFEDARAKSQNVRKKGLAIPRESLKLRPCYEGITFLQVRTALSANSSFYKLVLQALANN